MFRKIIKIILSLVPAVIIALLIAQPVSAANLTVEQLVISFPGTTLFGATNIAPGYSEVKTITVKNNGAVPHSFSIAVDGDLGSLANALVIEPRVSGLPVWSKTLADIAKNPQSDVIISSINPGATVNVDMVAMLPASTGNAYQGTSTALFSFILGNESTDQPESITTPIVVFPPTTVVTPTTVVPTTAPPATPPATTPLVPNNTNNPTVSVPQEQGQAAGASTAFNVFCYWWWVLLIVYALFLLVYGILNYNANGLILGWMWPIFGGAVLYMAHWILHSYYTPVKWCDYFVWFELIELVIYYIIYRYFVNRKNSEGSTEN